MSEVYSLQVEAPVSTPRDSDLASTLASRICHDLTSPLGAIANGVELLALSGAQRSPEMDLISESVGSANARLRFFRLAYGAAGPQPVGRTEIVRTLAALSQGSRHHYHWLADGDHPRTEVKAVFLLLQCLEATLPLGGDIRVAREAETWVATAEGRRLRIDLPAWDAFHSQGCTLPEDAAHVQFRLLSSILSGLQRPLGLSFDPERVEARF